MSDLNSLASQLNSVNTSLRTLGIDLGALRTASAAFQLIGGSAQVIKGLIGAKQAYNTARAAWGAANIAKWGPGALAVGAMAVTGGVLMGQMIERYANVDDSDAGLRMISGGGAYGRE